MREPRRLCLAAVLSLVPFVRSLAQCPDGTPPPCRAATTAPAPLRRVNPPLDDRTWIVVPFENVTRATDIDWLKDASVNLLYLDMSKWHDIKVIDDERVADLIRDTPEARGVQLTLQSGIAVAKRAGAGNLVMGDLLKVGTRTQLVGKVFDVRTGQRVRTVRQEAANSDSIMGSFGQLARGVLNLDPPSGGSAGGIGTTSIGAYQAYIAGVGFLNRWILDSAKTQFSRAIELDSTFALAHYKLALVFGWDSPGNGEGPRQAALALRLGPALPPRERAMVQGYSAFSSGHYGEACDIFAKMVRADSTDVEGWYNLGECSYHDPAVVALGGDSARMIFRGNWNTALRAFRKTLELDPTYHLAFQHIQDALLVSSRNGCVLPGGRTQCAGQDPPWLAFMLRNADSLVLNPVDVARNPGRYADQGVRFIEQHARVRNLAEARQAAETWLQAGPNESRPKVAYARILLRSGDPIGARAMLRQLRSASYGGRVEASNIRTDRVEAALKVDSFPEAIRVADSLHTLIDSVSGANVLGAVVWSLFGHSTALAATVKRAVPDPPWVTAYFLAQARAIMGAPTDSLFEVEAVFSRNATQGQGAARAAQLLGGTLVWVDPRIRGNRWPASDTLAADPRLRLYSYLATGDTVRFRRALLHFDSLAVSLEDGADNGIALSGAYAHLALADTAGALRYLRSFRDSTWLKTPILDQLGPGFTYSGMLWARTFLLLGDLAAATGHKAEALAAYRRFVAMWQDADAELQPMVTRARAAITALGG